jgi:hypothetical protein
VHLLGYPAAGKRTVGVALVNAGRQAGVERFVLIDNHLTGNPILAVLDGEGGGRVGQEVWDLVDEVREIVDRAILELAPPQRSFIFTNSAMVGDASGERSLARVRHLAHVRHSVITGSVRGGRARPPARPPTAHWRVSGRSGLVRT